MVEQAALDLIQKAAKSAYQGEWVAKIDPETLKLTIDNHSENTAQALANSIYIGTMRPLVTLALIDEIKRLQSLLYARDN